MLKTDLKSKQSIMRYKLLNLFLYGVYIGVILSRFLNSICWNILFVSMMFVRKHFIPLVCYPFQTFDKLTSGVNSDKTAP